MATKNKGELSELYAFVYALGNSRLPLANEKLHVLGRHIEFRKLYRKEDEQKINDYKVDLNNEYDLNEKDIVDIKYRGKVIGTVARSEFKDSATKLLALIQDNHEIDDDNETIITVKERLHTKNMSAKSADKSDFSGEIVSPDVPGTQHLGFSVKSNLGSAPTLINSNGKSSAFRYEVLKNGRSLTESDFQTLNQFNSAKNTTKKLLEEGYELRFSNVRGVALNYNLRLIDSAAPELIASLLVERFCGKNNSDTLSTVIDRICEDDIVTKYPAVQKLGSNMQERLAMLSFKTKAVLLGFATGATVGKVWDGRDEANGGFIVVKNDGEVVCLELFNRNAIGEYLLNWTYFENPSRARHGHDQLYLEDGKVYVDLQFQVRFKK